MDDRGGGSFVAVRRVSPQGVDRSNTCQTTSAQLGSLFDMSNWRIQLDDGEA
ncbi:hypothetical protein Hanom_Chr00s000003g01604371 [Helianthus anomalus]